MLTLLQYAPDLKFAITVAQAIARENHHAEYSPAHLLKGILHNDIGLGSMLAAWGKNVHFLREWADVRISRALKSARPVENPPGDEKVAKLLEVADVVRLKLSEEAITPICVLAAMCKPNVAFPEDQLKTFPLTEKELLQAALESIQAGEQAHAAKSTPAPGKSSNGKSGATSAQQGAKALYKFCIDKTELAKEGKIDPIVGRDREIRKVAEVLGRRTKPNVIIVGEPGVGKTALVEGFAQRIMEGNVAPHLQNAQVFELDMGALVAGASYKGEIEERLNGIIGNSWTRLFCSLTKSMSCSTPKAVPPEPPICSNPNLRAAKSPLSVPPLLKSIENISRKTTLSNAVSTWWKSASPTTKPPSGCSKP